MKQYPPVTIIIVTLNANRTVGKCLNYIKNQNYSRISEVLIIDGGSTDETLKIARMSGLPIRIIDGGYKDNQEARRAIGVENAKNEICVMLDTDNYILSKNWIKNMVEPLLDNKEVIASQTLRYAAPRNTTLFNRYFGLVGAGDPIAYYLGKSDRLSFAFDKWNLLGKVISENKKYYVIKFDPNSYPTLGCNGIVFRKSIILKSKWKKPENYVHTDVFVDIARLGYSTFAIVKNEVFHDTADSILNFFKKRREYMLMHHAKLGRIRRYKVFNSNHFRDYAKLLFFVFYALTLVEPMYQSFRGYYKKRDIAWFLHPVACLGIMVVYSEAVIVSFFKK